MKKSLASLFLLSSLSAFALTEFQTQLSESQSLLQASTNYEAKDLNDDGSTYILNPKFSNPQGQGSLYISQNSDLNGLCKLYGLGNYVSNSYRTFNQGTSGSVVRINFDARFEKFDSSNNTNAISTFSCEPVGGMPNPSLISTNLEGPYLNDDGSVTIVKPKFKFNGSPTYISQNSDLNGLCKLYGLGNYVTNSYRTFNQGTSGSVVRINSNARFERMDASNNTNAISSLICSNN
jgi:hypothetical protein